MKVKSINPPNMYELIYVSAYKSDCLNENKSGQPNSALVLFSVRSLVCSSLILDLLYCYGSCCP